MNAQPQTDPVRVVKNITPQTNALGRKHGQLLMEKRGLEAAQVGDSINFTLLGEYVTASYLVDRKGVVWALGTMVTPFVIHTFSPRCFNCQKYLAGINTVATEYADELITFVLMPTPEDATTLALIELFNDDVVVLFDDHYRDQFSFPTDPRLLGIIGYPVTHFISKDRRIVGLANHGSGTYLHPKKGDKRVEKKWERDLAKRLRKGIERLLKWEETRENQE